MDNKNKVELLGWYGGDKRACLSAWQSTTSELGININDIPENARIDEIFSHLAKKKKKTPYELLEFLAVHNHATPFEKLHLDFQIVGDIASHIHTLKHRISHINSESARYREVSDKFYLPEDWKNVKVKDKENVEHLLGLDNRIHNGIETWYDVLNISSQLNTNLYHKALTELEEVLGRSRAKESARYFLQYNKQLNFDWQMNFRSFVNIQRLRNKPEAQKEIREIADEMLRLTANIEGNPFEGCLKAFGLKSN